MDRRQVIATGSAAAILAAGSQGARADDAISPEAARLYARAIVFDANLSPPIQDKFPFPPSLLATARDSGVTAMKTSLGGIDEDFEAAVDEISFMQRMIEKYPDVYIQVRGHADFARAKQDKRVGIVLSFEAATMLADKIDRARYWPRDDVARRWTRLCQVNAHQRVGSSAQP